MSPVELLLYLTIVKTLWKTSPDPSMLLPATTILPSARTIKINETLKKVFQKHRGNGLIFMSQKNSVFTTQSLNRILKKIFKQLSKKEQISTHSLRKSFGRRVYDMNGQSEHALIKLSEVFGHSSIQLTRIYLGLKQEELNEVYMNL